MKVQLAQIPLIQTNRFQEMREIHQMWRRSLETIKGKNDVWKY